MELQNAANSLKTKIAPGPDGIPNEIVKSIAKINPEALIKVYNTCLKNGTFPETWKATRLVLIRKGDKPLGVPFSYRPLCLLDCLGKLLEKIIDNHLREFLDTNDGLYDRQIGFRKECSTIDTLNTLKDTIKPNQKVGILTLDIRNTFNSAPWKSITDAMYEKEIPGYIQNIIGRYLENRTLVFGEDRKEMKIDVTCGVPQVFVIGPTLWKGRQSQGLDWSRAPTLLRGKSGPRLADERRPVTGRTEM